MGFLEVLKRSDKREKYSRAKLLRSLFLALDHLPDPETAMYICQTIEKQLIEGLPETSIVVSSEDIAQVAQDTLKRFDARSYVKYLSYQTKMLDAADIRRLLKREMISPS